MYFQFKAPLHSAAPAGADVIEEWEGEGPSD